ncbi:MAG: hypothetical protein HYS26_03110 [Candidatus Kaiserbacteria bacterium]|nr:MAG: hypothetical protein HYS26_03110 [Candidatus Kaiserbacteria bacterium]
MNLEDLLAFFTNIPTDWIIIGGFALFAAFITVRSGSERVSTLALALPAAVLLRGTIGNAMFVGGITEQFNTPVMQTILFAVLVVALYIFISRIGLSWGGGAGKPLQAAITGVAAAAILAVIWISTPSLSAVWQFGPSVEAIFGDLYAFWWLLCSYAALAFVRS